MLKIDNLYCHVNGVVKLTLDRPKGYGYIRLLADGECFAVVFPKMGKSVETEIISTTQQEREA